VEKTMLESCPVRNPRVLLKRLTLAAFAGVLALSFAGVPALAADDEEEAYELQFLKKMFGITDQPTIEYRERSPLVVPPTRNLPSPETMAAGTNNPAWPQDATNAPKKKKAQKVSVTDKEVNDAGRPISPYELDKGRKAGAGLSPSTTTGRDERGAPLSPSELGYKGGVFNTLFKNTNKDEVTTFSGEPPRTTLTSPPTGYMTPSPNYPYGLSAKKEAPKPFKLEDRGTEMR
jgi:hypothetical protein